MKRKGIVFLMSLLFSGLLVSQSYASYLFDTGTPDPGQGWTVSYYLTDERPLVASQFSNPVGWEIGSIEGYFWGYSGGETWLQANIWDNNPTNDYIPGSLKFQSAAFLVGTALSWQGVFGLTDWTLPAGTYWVGFTFSSGPSDRNFAAHIVAGAIGVPDNSLRDAQLFYLNDDDEPTWYLYDYDHCIRIGDISASNPVPVPTTLLLLGSGLAGLAGFRRKFKKA